MSNLISGNYNKFAVALLGALSTSLTTYYGTAHWLPVVLSVMGALVVWLVPNTPKQ